MAFQLENCCFCGDLRTGSLIIGYLTLIRDIILTAFTLIFGIIFTVLENLKWTQQGSSINFGPIIPIFWIVLIICIISLTFTVFLLIGLHEYKNKYIQAYLIYNMVIFVKVVLLTIIFGIRFGQPEFIPLVLFFVSFHVYYMLVVRSYALKMDPLMKPAIFRTPDGPPLTAAHIS